MLPEAELVQYIHKTADMGVSGIDSVLPHVEQSDLREALEKEKEEYLHLRQRAEELLKSRKINVTPASPMAKSSAKMMSCGKLIFNGSPSKVAEMTIEGTVMGVTKTIKHLKDYEGDDEQALTLARKLLQVQESNVEEMKAFL